MTALLGGKYVLEERLGGGGMAEVFRGRCHGVDGFVIPVAIKRVLPGLAGDPRFAELFVTEAQICAHLMHRNIVSVLDFDRDEEGRHFLVMELVGGSSLDRLLATGPLPFPVVVHVAVELLRGLGYAHEPVAGVRPAVIHRDISPHNVLVSWRGEVKISDFGVAKLRTATQATASELIKGKPAYMSPEQANGEALDGRSDLFAAGVVLWEMLADRELFSGDTTQETLARLLFAPIPSPREVRPEVPDDLARIAMRLLARERGARYRDAAAAIADLEACRHRQRDGEAELAALIAARVDQRAAPIERPPPPRLPGPLDAMRARRRRYAILLAALAIAGAAIGLAVALRPREPPAAGDAGVPVPALPLDRRAAHQRMLDRQAAGERTAIAVAQARSLDPYEYYARARAAAERVLGKVFPTAITWRNFDRRGRIDTTASGGLAEYVFVAQDPALTGEYCFAAITVEHGRASLVVERPTNGLCRGAIAPPACTMAQLWERARERGLPADAQQASAHRIGGSWSFVIGETSEQLANDCR